MSEKLTPMMQQYRRVKSEIPAGTLLLFRLGDFYEMFFEDAKEGASILGLTLTKRNGVPMCGVPFHAADNYIARLVEAGKRVAICEQTSEPKPGQIVERQVTQILSPGNTSHLELTQPKENRFLASVVVSGPVIGFSFLDLTTGEFRVTEFSSCEAWIDEMLRLQPKEIIYPEEQELPQRLEAATQVSESDYDAWVFEQGYAVSYLQEHFAVQSLDGFGCSDYAMGIAAAGGLLHYAKQRLLASVDHVRSLLPYRGGDYLVVDATTQRNLELIQSLGTSASDTSLLKALDETVTPMGGRELRRWLLHPLRDVEMIEQRQQMVGRFLEDIGPLEDIRDLLREVKDLERLITRLSQGSGNARDLLALGKSLDPLPGLQMAVAHLETSLAASLSERIQPQPDLVDLVGKAIVDEPPLSLKEGGIIRDGYFPEVDELRSAARDGKAWIAELQAREQERTGIKSLKVRFNQVFGYYIEITKSNLGQVPDEYTRKQTLVNAERFITPELKEMESKILGAEERIQKLEYELFINLRKEVVQYIRPIQEAARAIAALDVLSSFSVTARLHQYCRPKVRTGGRLFIDEGRHPVLEQLEDAERFVPNDVNLNEDDCRLMILTGPNMAGKSTYIRQVALIALMAHTGSYVPAKAAEVSILDRVFTRVGASDDLSRGQSTFMVEMNETANILNNASQESLVILDEIGRGTSTFDGLSIAWSVAEFLHSKCRAKTLFATHYHELTELAAICKGVKNFNVAVREWHDRVIFLRKIVPGGTDKSYGIQVARLAGLPREVIDRAKEILRNLEENELDATGQPNIAHKRDDDGKGRRRKRKSNNPKTIPQMDLFKQSAE
ncbi:MAG: DNA mismatch repair protein MutS [Verrucomicrobiota bacterium]